MRNKILITILVIGAFLRLFQIDTLPAGFNQDEASFGYDAFSILETGRDQWDRLPFPSLKSFGDYKLPVYTFLTIPFVAIFGLSEFAVRLPNAIFGVIGIFYLYKLCKENFNNEIAFLAAFLLAISPWHIALSRGAFEANLASSIITAAVYHFYHGLKNNKHFVYSSIYFSIGLFSYHSIRLIIPLLVSFLIIQNYKNLSIKKLSFASIIFVIFLLIAFSDYATGAGSRLSTSSIFNDVGIAWDRRYLAVVAGENQLLATIFNNKYLFILSKFTSNYLQYFSPQFLFTTGAGEATYGMIPGVGLFYYIEIIFILIFVYAFSRNEYKYKVLYFVIFWLLVAPIPASLTSGSGYSANRSAVLMPAYQIISALGAYYLAKLISDKYYLSKNVVKYFLVLILVVSSIFFLENYYFKQKIYGAKDMKFGMKETMFELSKIESNYDNIIFSKSFSEPHIFIAFYNKMDPEIYQKETKNWQFEKSNFNWVDQLPEYKLDKYVFTNIDYVKHSQIENTVMVGRPEEFPFNVSPFYQINYPNGEAAVYFVESKKI